MSEEEGIHEGLDLSDLEGETWRATFREAGKQFGFHENLGDEHEAVFVEEGRRLIVSFEVDSRMDDPATDYRPRSWVMGEEAGWSTLTLLSRGETWFRDPAVYRLMDRLTDDGFFDDFEEVLFYGAGSGGYAAATFSVAAPGARVLALRPQATLSADTAGWDGRYRAHRMRDFEGRYGYAPDMLDAADAAYVLYDPHQEEDAMHAALFRRVNVMRLRCPHMGLALDRNLHGMGILTSLMRRAMAGDLTALSFARAFRARRKFPPYLRGFLAEVQDTGRVRQAIRVARHGLETTGRPLFRKRLGQLQDQAKAQTAAE
ncbi:phosphoadenosine phosphosulfate reductase [Histidinibacterium aquaticum]|uniref:Phosphoadenosine phosphosulfate reductase n=1 Tax=Histidinibacterium aquaticum TaxID=2613962 RepID=A0A5J5GCG2_9RHOB|nr:phosphoadenosine phosphosulfate reductase [Histidinibacterium aquaticum]KAA9005593.1 phosphoadenosine phosphosulfate reductase [Histidinibacterium aquaticum]